jgi:hypothetical protein
MLMSSAAARYPIRFSLIVAMTTGQHFGTLWDKTNIQKNWTGLLRKASCPCMSAERFGSMASQ